MQFDKEIKKVKIKLFRKEGVYYSNVYNFYDFCKKMKSRMLCERHLNTLISGSALAVKLSSFRNSVGVGTPFH